MPHPAQSASAGYQEIQSPPAHYHIIIDCAVPAEALVPLGASSATHADWVDTTLRHKPGPRARQRTASLVVAGRGFVERIETELGHRVADREV